MTTGLAPGRGGGNGRLHPGTGWHQAQAQGWGWVPLATVKDGCHWLYSRMSAVGPAHRWVLLVTVKDGCHWSYLRMGVNWPCSRMGAVGHVQGWVSLAMPKHGHCWPLATVKDRCRWPCSRKIPLAMPKDGCHSSCSTMGAVGHGWGWVLPSMPKDGCCWPRPAQHAAPAVPRQAHHPQRQQCGGTAGVRLLRGGVPAHRGAPQHRAPLLRGAHHRQQRGRCRHGAALRGYGAGA